MILTIDIGLDVSLERLFKRNVIIESILKLLH